MGNKQFGRLLKYDLTVSLLQNRGRILGGVVVQFFNCGIVLVNSVNKLDFFGAFTALMWGSNEYIPESGGEFTLPVAWLVIMLYALFIVTALPNQSLNGSGKIAFIKSVERKWWWASKCICITIIICASFLVLYGMLFLQVLVSGGSAAASADSGGFAAASAAPADYIGSGEVFGGIMAAGESVGSFAAASGDFGDLAAAGAGFGGGSGAVAWGFVLPVLVCISLAIAENTIALFLNPAAGYISAIVILVVSTYFKRGWLLENYGMMARIRPYSENGLPPEAGLIWTGAVIALSIAAGARKLRRSDLM